MLRKRLFMLLVVALSLAVAVQVLAVAPGEGVVVEGVSVPGIELGFSRAQVQVAYGEPASCQSGSSIGDYALCSYLVEDGGRVWVHYRGADGGGPSNSPDDVANRIQWGQLVAGWTTTAGVNTSLALADPDAVIAAYPNARVTYTTWGSILQVRDYELGIQVDWRYNLYSGTVSIGMAISAPSEPPPPREPLTRVASIDLSVVKRGGRELRALMRIEDDRTLAASGATVFATWQYPDGTTVKVEAVASGSGYAYFEVLHPKKGTYTLTVDNVVLDEHRFDKENSVLSESIHVK